MRFKANKKKLTILSCTLLSGMKKHPLILNNSFISWRSIGKQQQTLASPVARTGTALHSGARTSAALFPAPAGQGRSFLAGGRCIPASADFISDSRLCTAQSSAGATVRTVEHLLSPLDALGVDISGGDEVPLLDGSSREWVEAIDEAGLCPAIDSAGHTVDKMVPVIGRCWFSCFPLDPSVFKMQMASARTFCIYEEDVG